MSSEALPEEQAEAAAGDVEMTGPEETPPKEAAKEAPEEAAAKEEAEAPKAEGEAEAAKEKEPEKPKELEEDAPPDSRGKLTSTIGFNTDDTTLNVMPTSGGKLLLQLADGGFQYLLAGARANVGFTAGRYMFEVMILGDKPPGPPQVQQNQQPSQRTPQQVVRVGFAAAGSSLFLADGEDNVCFDSEGMFIHGKLKKRVSQKFIRDQVVAVLLNLDSESPNANTVSLFRDGARIAEPQPLPECLKGKALFPAVSYKGTMLRLNFTESPIKALPFKCRMIQDAAEEDCELVPAATPQDGRHEVVFPVGLPDEGTFDWVDQFIAKNPKYIELSNRMIIEWATKSGLWRKNYVNKGCNDKPEMGFGVPQLDDMSVPRLLASLAPALARSFVVAEVKGNLIAETRRVVAARFAGFRRTACVLMGEPDEDFRRAVHAAVLREKRLRAEAEQRKKKVEADKKKQIESKRQGAKKAGEDGEAKAEDAPKQADDDAMEEEDKEVIVELTEEEKQVSFRKRPVPDMLPADLAKSFTRFSIPEAEEGFDEIRFEWQPLAKCSEYLREWLLKRKATQRVEDIQPSKWFFEKSAEWQKGLQEWKKKQIEWKKVIEQLKEWKKEGEKKGEETKDEDKKEGEDKPTEIDADDLDVFAVENVLDIGSGEPLFANFEFEDWCLISLRYELHLLVFAFRRDMDDPDRTTFHENHLPFYFNRYYKKALDLKLYGLGSHADVVEMVKDTVVINSESRMLEVKLAEDISFDHFVKLTEEHRRDRQRRLDAGDETAELKFTKPVPTQPARAPSHWQQASNKPQYQAAQKTSPQTAAAQKTAGTQPQPPRYTPGTASKPQIQAAKTQYQLAPRTTGQQAASSLAQKRPFTPAPKATIQPAAKQARTAYGGGARW